MEEHDPEVTRLLEQVMDESTVGDPRSPRKWNSTSTYQIREYLARPSGHEDKIQQRLRKLDYSLQANRKDQEGKSHADRDRQFGYINETAKRFLRRREPVISVNTQKKERFGNSTITGEKGASRVRRRGQQPPFSARRSLMVPSLVLARMCTATRAWGMGESPGIRRNSPSRVCGAGGGNSELVTIRTPNGCSSVQTAEEATLLGTGLGSTLCSNAATRRNCRLWWGTLHRGRASGTGSSTACSPLSACTGRENHWSASRP
jgi:hypothetical protein